VLEHALTVRLIKDVQDVEVIADLLAWGMVQDRPSLPQPPDNLPSYARRTLVAVIAVTMVAVLTTYQVWRHSGNANSGQPPVEPPSPILQWQQSELSDQHPAGSRFTVHLPILERIPDGLPVEVTLDPSSDLPSWLQFDREELRISGTPPMATQDRIYNLLFHAKAEGGGESRLPLSLTIKGRSETLLPQASDPSEVTSPSHPRQNFLHLHHSW
jgi:hypothetical protein